MRNVYTFILAGCVSFGGFAVYAQSPGSEAMESIRQLLTTDEAGEEASLSDRMNEMLNPTETPAPQPEEEVPILDVPIISSAVDVPSVNQGTAEVIDTRGRYRPRLKMSFAEFPLRSLEAPNPVESELSVKKESRLDAIAQRIKDRYRLTQLDLSIKNRKVFLSGTVDTEHQRNIIAAMLRFEPGVDSVQNDITLSSDNPASDSPVK